jgi:AF1548-like protein/ATP cone domain-containing protein/restriction endonuclease
MQNGGIYVIKGDGERVLFEESKLQQSLIRSGASKHDINRIIRYIHNELYDGIKTGEIYKKAYAYLKKISLPAAGRYKLKKAIFELGPSGYPFERFIGALMENEGFSVEVGVIVQGHCVQHEVDVVAENGNEHFMVECKFHNDAGRKSDVKVPLYIHSRFKDIERKWKQLPGHQTKFHQGWIVTNTRFSEDALAFGKCMGMKLISWDYPVNDSLRDRIDRSGLYPVTVLKQLTRKEKKYILDKDIVLCKTLVQNSEILDQMGMSPSKARKVIGEANALCGCKK